MKNNLNFVFWNTRGIRNFYELTVIDNQLITQNCAILALSETWQLISFHPPQLQHMTQISILASKNRAVGRPSGGLELFYDPKYVNNVEIINTSEIWISIKCTIDETELIVTSVYIRDHHAEDRINMLQDLVNDNINKYPRTPMIIA